MLKEKKEKKKEGKKSVSNMGSWGWSCFRKSGWKFERIHQGCSVFPRGQFMKNQELCALALSLASHTPGLSRVNRLLWRPAAPGLPLQVSSASHVLFLPTTVFHSNCIYRWSTVYLDLSGHQHMERCLALVPALKRPHLNTTGQMPQHV